MNININNLTLSVNASTV